MLGVTYILARSTDVRARLRNLYGTSIRIYCGIAIALIIHSLDPSLSSQLITRYPLA